jgi:hypothetical protein
MNVSAHSHFSGTVKVIGGQQQGDARVALFGSANVTGWSKGPGPAAYEVVNGGRLLIEDAYSESFMSNGKLFLKYLHAHGTGVNQGQVSLSITTNAGDVPLDMKTDQYEIDGFPGVVSFLSGTYWLGQAKISGNAASTSVLALGGQFQDIPPENYPPEAKILMTNRGQIDSGWWGQQPDIAVNVPDPKAFILETLDFRRKTLPVPSPLAPTAANTTDIRVSRVRFFYGETAEIVLH